MTPPSQLQNITNPQEKAYKVLVSSVISLRTKEKVTWQASERLYPQAANWQALCDMPLEALQTLIYPCGFYKRKGEQLQAMARIILEKYAGDVPTDMDSLLALPGVGRKVANLVLTEAFELPGLCVDSHVHRISNRWALVKTKNPDATELALRQALPQKHWRLFNQLLVQFGQTICQPLRPKCAYCFLSEICPFRSDAFKL